MAADRSYFPSRFFPEYNREDITADLNIAVEWDTRLSGSQRFHQILDELGALHDQKQQDYGTDEDPFANVRAATDYGIPAWVGAAIRMNDKMRRLQAFARNGTLANEGVEDSFKDLAVYAIIGLILFEEDQNA
jgi:hypothetical protein